jgi:hypothetical protein
MGSDAYDVPFSTVMTRPYQVVRFNFADDSTKILGSYATYDAADEALDRWCDRFPHAYIDIYNKDETNDFTS